MRSEVDPKLPGGLAGFRKFLCLQNRAGAKQDLLKVLPFDRACFVVAHAQRLPFGQALPARLQNTPDCSLAAEPRSNL